MVPTDLDFGTVTIGEYLDLTFTVTNTGGGTLAGSISEACDHYAITAGGGAYSLTAGQFVEVTVRFAPTSAGTQLCAIQTGAACATVSCTGVGEDQSGTEDRKDRGIPGAFSLSQNSPNPFSPTTEIRYGLPADCHVRLQIYDILGKQVTTLVDEYQAAGYKIAYWDGRSGDGMELSSGIYLCRLESGSYIEFRKMILAK